MNDILLYVERSHNFQMIYNSSTAPVPLQLFILTIEIRYTYQTNVRIRQFREFVPRLWQNRKQSIYFAYYDKFDNGICPRFIVPKACIIWLLPKQKMFSEDEERNGMKWWNNKRMNIFMLFSRVLHINFYQIKSKKNSIVRAFEKIRS